MAEDQCIIYMSLPIYHGCQMSKIKYTKELLEPIVKECKSFAQVIKSLGLSQSGGTQTHITKKIREYEIDTSHFLGQSWSKDKVLGNKYPIDEYLNNNKYIHSDTLKKRLIKENYFEHKCYNCGLKEWLGEPIPIELHHKDHNHSNNNLSNLSILCPNCHAFKHKTK